MEGSGQYRVYGATGPIQLPQNTPHRINRLLLSVYKDCSWHSLDLAKIPKISSPLKLIDFVKLFLWIDQRWAKHVTKLLRLCSYSNASVHTFYVWH